MLVRERGGYNAIHRHDLEYALIEQIVGELERALHAAAVPGHAQSMQRFFPEPVSALGVSNAGVAVIAAGAVARHPGLAAAGWLEIAGHFARAHECHEHLILASALAAKVARGVDDDLLGLIKGWLERDVGNWAQCDDLCIKPLYVYLKRRPQLLASICGWGTSDHPWCRRASNVALVKFVGRSAELPLAPVLANCERLLPDPDPYVQKGIGWMLKVAGQREPEPVIAFVRQHLARIDRPTLRYAIEKLPADVRRSILSA